MDLQTIFVSNLKKLRKERHITQEKLAELCHKETSYIGQIEIKHRFPSLPLIEKISEVLNVKPYILFKESDYPDIELKKEKIENIKEELLSCFNEDITKILEKQI